jgi:cobalt-zinc-cadmium efflux system outer membrane protein
MKTILFGIFLGFIVLSVSPAANAAESTAVNTELQQLTDEAARNNPELRALESKIESYGERPAQAESLDNPRLGFGIVNLPVDSFRFDEQPMTMKQVSVWQKFPFPGKLGLKGDIAKEELEAVRKEYAEKKNSIVMQVQVAYHNLLFINKSIEVTKDNRDLLRNFVKTAETKYAVGKGVQQDVLKAQVELSKAIDMLLSLDQKKESIVARLNTLTNRPADMKIDASDSLPEMDGPHFTVPYPELQNIAVENRPALLALKHIVQRYEFAQRLAERNYYPDIDVGFSYGQRDNLASGARQPDFVSGFVTISIPLWFKSKESRKVNEERANLRTANEQYNSARNNVYFQIKDILTEIERYSRQIDLFKTGLIPQSRTSLNSAISGYQVNKIDFITLVNNQLTLYNYEIGYYQAITNYMNKLAELDAAVGSPLGR